MRRRISERMITPLLVGLVGMVGGYGIGSNYVGHLIKEKNPIISNEIVHISTQNNKPKFEDKESEEINYWCGHDEGYQEGLVVGYNNRRLDEYVNERVTEEFERRYPSPRGILLDPEISRDTQWRLAFIDGKLPGRENNLLSRLKEEGSKVRAEMYDLYQDHFLENN